MQRKTLLLIALTTVLLTVFGCKRVKHEVNTVYSVDVLATDIALKSDGYLFSGSGIFDPNLNEEVSAAWEIVYVDLGEVRLKVTDANLTDWLFAYQLNLKITDNTTGESISHHVAEMISLFPENGFVIPNTTENIAFFTNLLKNRHEAMIEITGNASQQGVILLFTFKINAVVALG